VRAPRRRSPPGQQMHSTAIYFPKAKRPSSRAPEDPDRPRTVKHAASIASNLNQTPPIHSIHRPTCTACKHSPNHSRHLLRKPNRSAQPTPHHIPANRPPEPNPTQSPYTMVAPYCQNVYILYIFLFFVGGGGSFLQVPSCCA